MGKEAMGGGDCGKSFEGRRPGMGAPGAGRRPLEPGWAGDERHMSPTTTKQDVLEGTKALASQPALYISLYCLTSSTTAPQVARQPEAEYCRVCTKGLEVMGLPSHSGYCLPLLPL